MNVICENCDTRLRMKQCKGRDGQFCLCYHQHCRTEDVAETITPFNTLAELYDKVLKGKVIFKTLYLKLYSQEHNLLLLMGHYFPEDDGKDHPIGWVNF